MNLTVDQRAELAQASMEMLEREQREWKRLADLAIGLADAVVCRRCVEVSAGGEWRVRDE